MTPTNTGSGRSVFVIERSIAGAAATIAIGGAGVDGGGGGGGPAVIVTFASSLPERLGLPSSSVPEAVTTSVCGLPALPETGARERAVVARPGRQLLRHVAGALAVEVAVDVVGKARDRDRVDRGGVLDLDVEGRGAAGLRSEIGFADFVRDRAGRF